MAIQTIETITNNLADGYNELEKGTFQEASEVQNQRRADLSLRNSWFYTANLPLFRMSDGELEYGLSGRRAFDAIAGEDIGEFTRQIRENGMYRLNESQIAQLADLAADIAWVKAADLRLQKENDEWSYFLIDTSDTTAKNLSEAQRPFAFKAHGSMGAKYDPEQEHPNYVENMNMLDNDGKIRQTILWLPTPTHISGYVSEGQVIARASWLDCFFDNSDFIASDRGVDFRDALRGVLKVREADVQKIAEAYGLLANPNMAERAAAMLTSETAAGISRVLSAYLTAQKQ